jgi:hypothetical protein
MICSDIPAPCCDWQSKAGRIAKPLSVASRDSQKLVQKPRNALSGNGFLPRQRKYCDAT